MTTPTPVDEQDAVEKLTAAVPGIGAGAPGLGGGASLPQGSLKLSAPNFLSKVARKDLYRAMVILGFVTVIAGVAVILLVHGDANNNWVGPSITILLVGFAAWVIAYLTVGGFGNVEVTVGSGAESAPAAAGGPTLEPADGATDVPTDTTVKATFETAVDPDTVTDETFKLSGPSDAVVPATVNYDVATKTATLTPTAALTAATKYTATITDAIKDVNGEAQAAATWTFTTK